MTVEPMFNSSDKEAIICDFKFIVAKKEELRAKYLVYDSRGIELPGIIYPANMVSDIEHYLWRSAGSIFLKEMPRVPIAARNMGARNAFLEYSDKKFSIKVTQEQHSFKRDIEFKFNLFPEIHNFSKQYLTEPIFLGDDRILFFVLVTDFNDSNPDRRGRYPKSVRKKNVTLNFVGCMCFPGDTFPTYHGIFMHVIDANSCKQILFNRVVGSEKLSDPYTYPRISILNPLKSDKTKIVAFFNSICPIILLPLCGIVIEYLIDFHE
ncbi:MAG: hypothetical protein Hyperionvirus1_98 [Hyperionvirus sp.]|uniref:Uncharacterized protein n=1 Tax=Hyperionvirus sp. TaxID=2487770 RepID=A0A3G5AB33_9VIRU|nr:MAG: hypothetical protein Hyperionvirus1_98 [Hyperionvirus sp.]